MKTIQHIALAESLTGGAVSSEDGAAQTQVSWSVFCERQRLGNGWFAEARELMKTAFLKGCHDGPVGIAEVR
jgi:hypothetical protein